MSPLQRVIRGFERRYSQRPPLVVRSPGRVNLIGEHTDYNAGFVLPMAIDLGIWVALQPRRDRWVMAHSLDFSETSRFSLDKLHRSSMGWGEYMKAVAWALQEAGGRLLGWEGVISGNIPRGAGLSSSAALELAAARAFAAVSDLPWDAREMAFICQRAENEWLRMNCGIMDQMACALGVKGHALFIDCRSLEARPVPLPPGMSVVVLDSATRRGLVDSAYNQRRIQCEIAALTLGVPALRNLTLAQLELQADKLDEVTFRRARHVVTENKRCLQAAGAMQRGDVREFGTLMNASHASLRDDFEVSTVELDAMVSYAINAAGCFGARLTGAGFGGCAVALVDRQATPGFLKQVARCYQADTGHKMRAYACDAMPGVEVSVQPANLQ